MKHNLLVKSGLLTVALSALLVFPLAGTAFAQSSPPKAAPANVTTAETTKKNDFRLLSWGVFAIVLGEFAGTIGMGLSKRHRQEQPAAAPVQHELPFPYEQYKGVTSLEAVQQQAKRDHSAA